jgi:hypothetical protein
MKDEGRAKAAQSRHGEKAEGRMQNAERRSKATQSYPKANARRATLDRLTVKSTFPADSMRARLGLSFSGLLQ